MRTRVTLWRLACAALLGAGGVGNAHAEGRAAAAAPDRSILKVVTAAEPGIRLVVSGRLLRRDGRPAGGQRIGVYHTDAQGQYGVHAERRSTPPRRDARLSGWLVTRADGRFEVRTIRPGAYPGGLTPQHIHFIVGGRNEQEMLFADDPILVQRRRTGVSGLPAVRPVTTDADGVQHVSLVLRLP